MAASRTLLSGDRPIGTSWRPPASIANYFGTGAHRAVPDVSMVGDPQTGFLVGQKQTFPDGTQKYW